MFIYPSMRLIAAVGIVTESAASEDFNVGEASDYLNTSKVAPPDFVQILETTYDKTNSIAERWSDIWDKTFNFTGGIGISGETLFGILCYVGLVAATGSLIFFAIHNFKLIHEQNWQEYFLSLMIPFLIALVLSNGGKPLSGGCFAGREFSNQINQKVLEHIMVGVTLQDAFRQLQQATGTRIIISNYLQHCEALTGDAQTGCLQGTALSVQGEVAKLKESAGDPDLGDKLYNALGEALDWVISATNPISMNAKVASLFFPTWESFVFSILGGVMRAYQHFMEISLYVTTMVSPFAVGGSLLPGAGAKPIIAWLSGFLSVGFAKLVFNVTAGLAAVAAVNDLTLMEDQISLYFIFGLGAPLLSAGMMVGGGMAIWKALTGAAEMSVGFTGKALDLVL